MKLLTKIDQTGSVDCKHGSGKKHTIRIAQNVDSVEELVLSQESAMGTHNNSSDCKRDWNFQSKAALL